MSQSDAPDHLEAIAVVGMAGRFPKAKNVQEFWRNLGDGVEAISFFTDEELEETGVASEIFKDPRYVRARGELEGVEMFDASFFGYTPREAEVTDPQHRLFLECAWEALEDAGYDPDRYTGRIGVFAGESINSYFFHNLYTNTDLLNPGSTFQTVLGNDRDFLATRVSYKLNLRGPSVVVQSACSTSLVAVHLACQSLLSGESDMTLAGGVSIKVPHKAGYFYL